MHSRTNLSIETVNGELNLSVFDKLRFGNKLRKNALDTAVFSSMTLAQSRQCILIKIFLSWKSLMNFKYEFSWEKTILQLVSCNIGYRIFIMYWQLLTNLTYYTAKNMSAQFCRILMYL